MTDSLPRPRGNADIDDAARRIAIESGLASITLRRIAMVAGVTPSEVATYEPFMNALVARTFEQLAVEELAATTADVAAETEPMQGLRVLVEALLHESHEGYNSVWADAWSLGWRSAPLAEAACASMAGWNAMVVQLVERGIATGDFHTPDPELVALQFIALIDSTTSYALVGYRSPEDRSRLVRRTLEMSLGISEGTL